MAANALDSLIGSLVVASSIHRRVFARNHLILDEQLSRHFDPTPVRMPTIFQAKTYPIDRVSDPKSVAGWSQES